MKLLILFIIAFLVLIYVYTFIRLRKKQQNRSINTIADFNKKYHPEKKRSSESNTKEKKYITKYSSQIDYMTKDELNH